MNYYNFLFAVQTPYRLYCQVLCVNILRWSLWSESTDFNYHQSMFGVYLEKHCREVVQHLTSALKEFTAFKILSSSFLPTVCDKTASNILLQIQAHMPYSVHCLFEKSLSHCSHSGLSKTLVKKYSIFHSSSRSMKNGCLLNWSHVVIEWNHLYPLNGLVFQSNPYLLGLSVFSLQFWSFQGFLYYVRNNEFGNYDPATALQHLT